MELPTERADYSKFDEETGEQLHNDKGQELPDSVPMAPPIGYERPMSMFDTMRAQIRAEHLRLQQLQAEMEPETVEEANDFEIDEDIENQPSLYEEKFDPVDYEVRQRLRQAEFRARYEEAVDKLPPKQKELLDGKSLAQSDERRDYDRDYGSVVAREKRESNPKSQSEPGDAGSSQQMDERAGSTKGEDRRGVKPDRR